MSSAFDKIQQLDVVTLSDKFYHTPFKTLFLKKHILPFTRNLYSLLNAHVPITRALELLEKQEANSSFKKVINRLKKDIDSGSSFYEALSRFPGLFDHFYLNMVEMGENIGKLDEALFHILEYKERIREIRRKIFQMMSYPALVLFVAFGAIVFLLTHVVPTFADMFRDFDARLPYITRVVLLFSEYIQNYSIWVFLIFFSLILLVLIYVRTEQGKKQIDFLLLKMPVWRYYYQHILILNFCLTMGTLLANGIPLLKALEIVKKNTTNQIMLEEIQKIHFFLSHGHSLKTSLHQSKIFTPMLVGIFEIGEETANLESMLLHIAKLYQEEMDYFLSQLVTFLEPAIIIFLGIVIGGILISMYLPLFELSNVIQ